MVSLTLPLQKENKNTKERQGQYHHTGMQQKHGG